MNKSTIKNTQCTYVNKNPLENCFNIFQHLNFYNTVKLILYKNKYNTVKLLKITAGHNHLLHGLPFDCLHVNNNISYVKRRKSF